MLLILFHFSLQFDKSFCEPPYPPYKPANDADLIQVQILSRHGARTPLHVPKNLSNIWICLNTEQASYDTNHTHTIHILNTYGKSIYRGNCQFGQLVGKGREALTRLGEYIRKIYVDTIKFLPTNYIQSIIKFRSTHTLRTLHSQMAFIRGLYPEDAYIQIEVADKLYDNWRRASAICPQLIPAMDQLSHSKEWKEAGLIDQNLSRIMMDIFGVKWEHTNDAATSARCQGLSLPPNVTNALIDRAVTLKAKQMQFIYSHDKIFPLFFSFSAAEMLNEMIKRVNGESKLRFIHWSAHDGNILAFLGYLGYKDGKWPPYGSYIIVELWRSRTDKQFFLQFRFNGDLMKVPRFSNNQSILFQDFRNFVTINMPDIIEECKFDIEKFQKEGVYISEAI